MKKHLVVPLMVIGLVFLGAYVALARGPMAGIFGCGPGIYADLSKEQAEKLWQIREKFRSDTETLRKEMFHKRLELRKLYADPNATEEQIRAKHRELNTLREKLSEKRLERTLQERKVFTPEQLKKITEAPFDKHGYGRFCRYR
ncbi:MAG: Spy/CpxP family protein refolding chaperone [Deltaproteobacteria bacterium]|nr:Spy/CpxP family protein refolding chaperone [Deltaproteobacteria bacterium]